MGCNLGVLALLENFNLTAMSAGLEAEAEKLLETHGIGTGKPPADPRAAELFHQFCDRSETTPVGIAVENRFFSGFQHNEIDWSKPVHGLLVDFKGDSMQIGMLLQHLEALSSHHVCYGLDYASTVTVLIII